MIRQLLKEIELLKSVRNKRDAELADLEQENERFKNRMEHIDKSEENFILFS